MYPQTHAILERFAIYLLSKMKKLSMTSHHSIPGQTVKKKKRNEEYSISHELFWDSAELFTEYCNSLTFTLYVKICEFTILTIFSQYGVLQEILQKVCFPCGTWNFTFSYPWHLFLLHSWKSLLFYK